MFRRICFFGAVFFAVNGLAQKVDDPPTFGGLTGSAVDGGVSYDYTSFGGIDAANTNFTGASGGDDLFENWWFYRVDGDTSEFPFPDPDTADYSGDTVTFTWADVDGRGFSAELVEVVADGGGPAGSVLSTLTIVNISSANMVLDLFAFADIDLGGSFGGDSATISGTDFISLADAGDFGEFRAGGADAVQVLAFPGLDPILSDAAVDDLDGSGFPFGPGDFTGAFQWSNLVMWPGGNIGLQVSFAVNQPAPVPMVIEVVDFAPRMVPALSTWGLIALALLLVVVGSLLPRQVKG